MKKVSLFPKSHVFDRLHPYTFLALLLLTFTTLRVSSILLLRPGGFITDTGPDQNFYLQFAQWAGAGKIAFFDFWMEYPPLMPWLAALAYRLSLSIPLWSTPIFGFNLIFRLLLLPFEVGTLALMWGAARQVNPGTRRPDCRALGRALCAQLHLPGLV